jgi:hypothetical protein
MTNKKEFKEKKSLGKLMISNQNKEPAAVD